MGMHITVEIIDKKATPEVFEEVSRILLPLTSSSAHTK